MARIKKKSRVGKVGHTGTLDPFATGVMLCCLNRATRLSRFFLQGTKKYLGVLYLGVETDTLDATGTVTATVDVDFNQRELFSKENIDSVFGKFQGSINQLPPVFSALKHKGVPLYKLARSGNPVQKPPRQVNIFNISVNRIDLPKIHFEVTCSAGTYVRTLCADIGRVFGCGGHLSELRRIESSGYNIHEALVLSDLDELIRSGRFSDKIISMADALKEMPGFVAEGTMVDKIKNGVPVSQSEHILFSKACFQEKADNYVKVIEKNRDLLAILKYNFDKNEFKYCCVFNN